MNAIAVAALALVAVYLIMKGRGRDVFGALRRLGRNYGLMAGLAVVALLALTGRIGLAVPAAFLLLGLHQGGYLALPENRRYTVLASPLFEVRLDENTGGIGGRVLKGTYAGRDLSTLDPRELMALYAEASGERRSRSVLEVYLDRRLPGWRENVETEAAARRRRSADAGAMSEEEAYEILGLQKGAGEADIRAAHRRLMKRVHPDQGGSTFLAVRINQAKDRLLSKHR
jgi:hypothetical protein